MCVLRCLQYLFVSTATLKLKNLTRWVKGSINTFVFPSGSAWPPAGWLCSKLHEDWRKMTKKDIWGWKEGAGHLGQHHLGSPDWKWLGMVSDTKTDRWGLRFCVVRLQIGTRRLMRCLGHTGARLSDHHIFLSRVFRGCYSKRFILLYGTARGQRGRTRREKLH